MIEDFTFFSSLFVCISLGGYYKRIDDVDVKRSYGAGLGLLVACLVCGHHVYHTVLVVWGNIIIIKCCDKRYLHLMSFTYTWIYLLYLHFNINDSCYVIWIHQTLALRLVGLAFEVHSSSKARCQQDVTGTSSHHDGEDPNILSLEPRAADIIAYAYFFIGLHRGPYYRWKIFDDHFHSPFGVLGDCRVITEQKLKKAFMCGFAYYLLKMKYSPELYYSQDFYDNYSADSRFLYGVPQLIMYFLYNKMIMMLCTCVCTETGFGVYPAKCMALPGYGPSTGLSLLKLAAKKPSIALEQEYNFSMIKCFEPEKLLMGPMMKNTVRAWDMPTRYWFWAYIYKNLSVSNNQMRSILSSVAWTMWMGPSLQHILISTMIWVYVHLEADFSYIYNTTRSFHLPWDIGFSIMRMFCLIYLTPCFVVKNPNVVLIYYASIFWMYHLVLLALLVFAVVLKKFKDSPSDYVQVDTT